MLLIVFTSCEKDLYKDAIQQKNELTLKKVSLKDLSKANNPKLFEAVDKIKNKKKQSKLIYDSLNDFYFDDTNGKVIEMANGYKSYTFQIYTKDLYAKVENVLFTQKENGEYEAYRVKYNFNEEELKTMTKDELSKRGVVYTYITAARPNVASKVTVPCIEISTWQSYPIDQGELTGNFGSTGEYVTIAVVCSSTITDPQTYTNSTGYSGWETGTFTNTSGSNTSGSNTGGVYTSPVTTPGTTFINSLNFDTRDNVLSLSNETQKIIFDYLTTYNFNDTAKAKAKYTLEHFNYIWNASQFYGTDTTIFNYFAKNDFSSGSSVYLNQSVTRSLNNPILFPTIIPFLIEGNINDTLLNPCSKGVFQQVKNTTVCDIAQVLAKLDANGSVFNTAIKSEAAPSGKPAQTIRNSAYNYTIYISTNYEDKTKLFIAASMFHEMVHAYFMSLFDDYFNPNPPNLNAYNDFAGLFHHYVTLKNPASINAADVHHQQMATDYVDAIARALQEYQTGIPVPSTSIPEQIYCDLAWGGLSDAPVFDATYPVGNPNRQRILNRYEAEQRNLPIGVIPNVQIPASLPCN